MFSKSLFSRVVKSLGSVVKSLPCTRLQKISFAQIESIFLSTKFSIVAQMVQFLCYRMEHNMQTGENAVYQHFPSPPSCFQRALPKGHPKLSFGKWLPKRKNSFFFPPMKSSPYPFGYWVKTLQFHDTFDNKQSNL